MVGGLRCVVIHVKCDSNRLWGYGAVGVENSPFLLLWPVAYTTACTTVQAVMVRMLSGDLDRLSILRVIVAQVALVIH